MGSEIGKPSVVYAFAYDRGIMQHVQASTCHEFCELSKVINVLRAIVV